MTWWEQAPLAETSEPQQPTHGGSGNWWEQAPLADGGQQQPAGPDQEVVGRFMGLNAGGQPPAVGADAFRAPKEESLGRDIREGAIKFGNEVVGPSARYASEKFSEYLSPSQVIPNQRRGLELFDQALEKTTRPAVRFGMNMVDKVRDHTTRPVGQWLDRNVSQPIRESGAFTNARQQMFGQPGPASTPYGRMVEQSSMADAGRQVVDDVTRVPRAAVNAMTHVKEAFSPPPKGYPEPVTRFIDTVSAEGGQPAQEDVRAVMEWVLQGNNARYVGDDGLRAIKYWNEQYKNEGNQ